MEAALEMEPPTELQVPILETLRSAYALSGKHDKALSLASKILDIDPSNSGARMYRAGMLEDQKDHEKAISDLDYLISNDPDDRGNYISRGRVFEKMGEKKAALADYKKAQEMKPDYRIAEQIEKLEQVQ